MKKRFKKIIFIFLIITGAFLLGNKITSLRNTANKSIPSDTFENSRILAAKIINGNDIIKKISIHEDCGLTSSCIEITNGKSDWYGTTDTRFPIALSENNLLKVTFKNDNESAGVSLISKYALNTDPWWKNKVNIDFAAYYKTLYVFLHTGKKEESELLFKQDLTPDATGQISVIMAFDITGKNFLFTDLNGTFNKEIDMSQISDKIFPDGLFPDNSLYFGIFIAPFSKLTISDFYLIPVSQTDLLPQNFIKNPASLSFIKMSPHQV